MRTVLVAALVLGLTAVATGVSFVLDMRAPIVATATPVCSGPADAAKRVLVVGDSWVGDSRLVAGLGSTARVCAVAYSGLNSQDVLASFAADKHARAVLQSELGQVTDAVAVVGVNDTIQHRGPGFYAEGVARLSAYLASLTGRVFVLELPITRLRGELMQPQAAIAALFACLNDKCADDVTARYRAAVAQLPSRLIDYDLLAPAFDAADFAPDGIHLTGERYAELGRVIANAVTAP